MSHEQNTVKSYLDKVKEKTYSPFIIELKQGEFIEIPSSNNLSNEFKFALSKYSLRSQEILKTNKNEAQKIGVIEDLFTLTNKTIPVFAKIDAEYGQTLWWIIYHDWLSFCKDQLQVSDLGK